MESGAEESGNRNDRDQKNEAIDDRDYENSMEGGVKHSHNSNDEEQKNDKAIDRRAIKTVWKVVEL